MSAMMGSEGQYNGHFFVDIPEGLSFLGSNLLDPFSGELERPLRQVYISSFQMSRYPTTVAQFHAFLVEASPKVRFPFSGKAWDRRVEERPDYPVTNVSWETASHYCAWLSERSGRCIALPTEAEWEKAARGGDDRIWPWGDEFEAGKCNSAESGDDFCPVTDFPEGASPYGCLHMSGGVWEWCEDFHHSFSHRQSEFVDPVNLVPAPRRVVKGGSAFCTKEIVRPACRDWTNSFNQGGGDDGFRICIRDWR